MIDISFATLEVKRTISSFKRLVFSIYIYYGDSCRILDIDFDIVLLLEVFQFQCPKVNDSIAVTHPRYADPEDCQYFYVCINGDTPRRNGCKLGQVFDDVRKTCNWARHVPEWSVFVNKIQKSFLYQSTFPKKILQWISTGFQLI